MYSFITDGNFIIFRETDDVPFVIAADKRSTYEHEVFKLHNTSKCIDWNLTEDTTKITFTIDETRYEDILLSSIDFDGDVCGVQQDFIDGVQGMFENLSGGGSPGGSSLNYAALFSQEDATSHPTINLLKNDVGEPVSDWVRLGIGNYGAEWAADTFPLNKTLVVPFGDWNGDAQIYLPISDGDAIIGYYAFYRSNDSHLQLEVYNAAWERADWFTLAAETLLSIKVEVYP